MAIDLQVDVRNEISSIRIADTQSSTETELPCTNIVIAAGAWSPRVFEMLFPHASIKLPIGSLAGHSLVVRSPRWTENDEERGCHSVFLSSSGSDGYSPEIFSRRGGHIYIAGANSPSAPLPDLATDAKNSISRASIQRLRETAREYLGQSSMDDDADDLEVVREGLCFRPITDTEKPILARIPDDCLGVNVRARPAPEGGVYLAAGHGPWGISLSLGTGKVMAEMVQDRSLSADVSGLSLRLR
jgi:glycine/D-amino acid oxidase-like deaminating enzyme